MVIAKDGKIQYAMDLHVTRNIQFTTLIKAPQQQREFNFRRIPNATEKTFHVDVSDDKTNRIIFRMCKEMSGNWRINDEILPKWICDVERKLHEVIENTMQQIYPGE